MEAEVNGQEDRAHRSFTSLSEKLQKRISSKKKPLIFIIIFVIAASALFVVGMGSLRASQEQTIKEYSSEHQETDKTNTVSGEWPALWGAPDNQIKCQKNESAKYSVSPVALEDIAYIQPIGELRESHIVPGDHGGINYKTSPSSDPVKVYAPADGFLVGVEKHPYTPPPGYPPMRHYHIYLEHSCTFFTGFVHLTEFSPEILAESLELKQLDADTSNQFKNIAPRIQVKAGQQLGTTSSFGLLGMVTVDLNHTNTGYLKPESYKGENWRIHSVGSLDYFQEPLRTQMLSKNPRTVEPRGGKIDFDILGKLGGNWFEEGTNGLSGNTGEKRQCGNFPCPYWEGHLALVYDYVDPTQLRFSIGVQHGLSGRTPFGVKGNGPDFKNISVADGIVKYELVGLKDISKEKGYDTETPLITVNDESRVLGTMLVQVIDTDTIKMEIFPDKGKEQVLTFTQKAKIYHR